MVRREEFNALQKQVEHCLRELDVQFQRIAQMQVELDQVRRAWTKVKPPKIKRPSS